MAAFVSPSIFCINQNENWFAQNFCALNTIVASLKPVLTNCSRASRHCAASFDALPNPLSPSRSCETRGEESPRTTQAHHISERCAGYELACKPPAHALPLRIGAHLAPSRSDAERDAFVVRFKKKRRA
jgi:hypothetical protein